MASTVTTGSLVIGLVDGMDHHIVPSGTNAGFAPSKIIYVIGNPNNLLTSVTGSDIAYDISTGKLYMGDLVIGAGGSGWVNIGSTT